MLFKKTNRVNKKDFVSTKKIGEFGEKLAIKYLKKQGYKIICTNYKIKYGEIDIIAKDDVFIVFIEVKYRSKNLYGLPSEAVDKRKQQKIRAVASQYLLNCDDDNLLVRFDVVEIIDKEIHLYKSAF